MVLPNDVDLLNPPAELEKRKHKLKRLVQSPNSFFMMQPLPLLSFAAIHHFFDSITDYLGGFIAVNMTKAAITLLELM
ncbi:hypothetical protein E3N88_17097 [Mikania micrantha]|uniref:Uncharacterized protein n=1 Tax=Mikania micrantha TaxID=192012 RepID=A0A5N6NQZ8_9ASTR|nr:hypothetical protein E3N88_17097 [Mikania micrantha]